MSSSRSLRMFTLLQKELQENKLSLVWTPIIIAVVLSVLMLLSTLLANRITAMGDTMLQVLMAEEMGISPVITINIGDDEEIVSSPPAAVADSAELRVQSVEEPLPDEDWNFSREWQFEPQQRDKSAYEPEETGSVNPALHLLHNLLLTVLILVTVNYLLSSLFSDRKDRSILFWKSMPVSEWDEVLARLGVALVVAPAIYIGVSLLLQMVFVLLAMLLVWRMDVDPFVTILGNIRFADLLLQQIGGWVMTALWIAPVYCWLMLASAWARRSPFMVAIAPVLALMLVETLLLGSFFVLNALDKHVPHFLGGSTAQGFYLQGAFWQQLDYISLLSGLLFAAVALAGCVYLRRYRFEI